jgi:hypothetical protein
MVCPCQMFATKKKTGPKGKQNVLSSVLRLFQSKNKGQGHVRVLRVRRVPVMRSKVSNKRRK